MKRCNPFAQFCSDFIFFLSSINSRIISVTYWLAFTIWDMGVHAPFLKHLMFATFMNNLECQYLEHTLK